jgi:hypothetical protein
MSGKELSEAFADAERWHEMSVHAATHQPEPHYMPGLFARVHEGYKRAVEKVRELAK